MSFLRTIASLLFVAAGVLAADLPAAPAANARKQALAELEQIGHASGATLGVSALDLASGERIQVNGGMRFPMASAFKVAVAVKLLDEVDKGRMSLADSVAIDPANLSPGGGELKHTRPDEQRSATLGELLGAMMRESDNTATDLILERVGGPAAVTLHLRTLGIDLFDVSRPTSQLVADAWGFAMPAPGERTAKALAQAQSRGTSASRQAAAHRFLLDARDTATPDAMATLLEKIQRGKVLGAESTALLLAHMEACKTGKGRIKAGLPHDVVVAHKTGTLTRVATNDVGIIHAGGKAGDVVVAIFLKGSPRTLREQERTLAQVAKALYRYFTR